MSDKCKHETTIVEANIDTLCLMRCTWGCGEALVSVLLPNRTTVTFTAAELAAMQVVVEAARRFLTWKGMKRGVSKVNDDLENAFAALDEVTK